MKQKTVIFPEDWVTAKPVAANTLLALNDLEGQQRGLLISVLLGDGTNLIALDYEEGTRFARTSGGTKWAVEERFEGDPPADEQLELISTAWRNVVNALCDAVSKVREGQE